MPFLQLNEAKIFYEVFGEPSFVDRTPILLIHGSTSTGKADWDLVTLLLARNRVVIRPDCRGHGQSENPGGSYRFKEMADDMAALVHALGYRSAHIIGHSNGGNVALVMLMEHPEVVESAILQAANAYVSQDLVEKEPAIFDPQRVAEEAPDWMNEMIALHEATHGEGYWRDLLRWTVQEIITEPNYTPDQLASVERPTLVIQGENDRVNAPARHAQFIARHIPYAEQWLPTGIGHSVHLELPFHWVERVEQFLDQRGDRANEALYRLRHDQYADKRSTIFDLRSTHPAHEPERIGELSIQGTVLTSDQRQAAIQVVSSLSEVEKVDSESIQVLFNPETPWALCNRPVSDLRSEPRSLAERVSQALLGEVVRPLQESGDWTLIQMERDGYIGWIHRAALHPCSREEAVAYQATCRVRVLAELLHARTAAQAGLGMDAGKLPFGVNLPLEQQIDAASQVRLPDGRLWWVDSSGLLPVELWPAPNHPGVSFTLDLMRRFVGVPYLWGGRSPFGYDCSGFAATFWDFLGIRLPRDADQQFQIGLPISGDYQPGDLLFFGSLANEETDIRQQSRFAAITHVAISLGGDEIIHANGGAWGVSDNSLDPASPRYRPWLREHLAGSRRYL